MKKDVMILILIFGLILNFNFISATFEIGNLSHSIQQYYGPSDYIKGWINISLENEPANSLFEDDEDNSISLIDLIKLNNWVKGKDYICSPLSCETSYSASEPEEIKTFALNDGESSIFGFKLEGDIASITSIDFTLESDVLSSCYNQLKIDFFNDGKIDIANNKSLYTPKCDDYTKKYGCFQEKESYDFGVISSKLYCQKIKLTESPGFWLGAWIREDTAGTQDLTMELYSKSGRALKKCELKKEEILETGGEVFCEVNYSVIKSDDYYVCIYSDEGTGNYKIRGYLDSLGGCGFQENPTGSNTEIAAYQIFAEGKRFAPIETLEVSNSLPNQDKTLAEKVHEYLTNTYGIVEGYIDCSSECVIPIKFISEKNQNIVIKDLAIIYNKGAFSGGEENYFYKLSGTSATIDADFQELYLDEGNFSVPDNFGNYTFSLSLGEEEIFEKEISVEKVPEIKSLTPRITAAAYPTEFKVNVQSGINITQYKWDFGDNDTKTTSTNKVIHTYESIKKYKLKVTAIDANQRNSSETFEIDVGSPIEIINKLLKKMLEDLSNIKKQFEEFPTFSRNSLESIIDTALLEEKLEEIQQANASAVSEKDYSDILTELLKLSVPESITTSLSADSISFYPKEENINLDVLETIGGGNYDVNNEDEYIEAIFGWNQKNMETKINFEELSANYEDFEEPILKIFKLDITKKNETSNPYLIIRQIENLKFEEDYSEREESGYIYITLTDDQNTISFSTTEDISFINLPIFISPAISELSILKEPTEKDKQLLKLAIFILIVFLLIIVGIIIYIILQEWYKKKYESYLFKNRNDLYNLISYVQSSRKKELKNKEIFDKLKKSGWKAEQINYVMRKYSGKRTGMPEIPIGKILSKFKKDKNIPLKKFSTKPNNLPPNVNIKNKKIFKI
jgi:PKD repeat protein